MVVPVVEVEGGRGCGLTRRMTGFPKRARWSARHGLAVLLAAGGLAGLWTLLSVLPADAARKRTPRDAAPLYILVPAGACDTRTVEIRGGPGLWIWGVPEERLTLTWAWRPGLRARCVELDEHGEVQNASSWVGA